MSAPTDLSNNNSVSNKCIGGKVMIKLYWQGKLQIEFRLGSMTGENAEHPRFITNWTGEEIMLEDNEFMATRCSKSSCRFSMENPCV